MDLSSSYELIGLTLQLNWLTKGFSNLILGGYSDTIGRRPVILASFVFYIVGTTGCALAPHIYFFLASRIVQGIGEGCATITSAIARDVLDDPGERMQMLAILGTLRPVSIIAAPSIGGLLGATFGWRRVFLMLSFWGIVNVLCVAVILPETLASPINCKEAQINVSGIFSGFKRISSHRESAVLVLTLAVVLGAPVSMLSNIAMILESEFQLATKPASMIIGSIPCTMILAAGVVALCCGKGANPLRVLRFGMCSLAAAGSIAIAVGMTPMWRISWVGVLIPIYCFVFAQSICIPPAMALYLQPWEADAGLASGVMSLFRSIIPAALGFGSTCIAAQFASGGVLVYIGGILFLAEIIFWYLMGSTCERESRSTKLSCALDAALTAEGVENKKCSNCDFDSGDETCSSGNDEGVELLLLSSDRDPRDDDDEDP